MDTKKGFQAYYKLRVSFTTCFTCLCSVRCSGPLLKLQKAKWVPCVVNGNECPVSRKKNYSSANERILTALYARHLTTWS
jgi:hypothetical protein